MFTPLALLAVVAFVTGSLAVYQITASRQSQAWIVHSHEVVQASQALFSYTQDVESGMRGYLVNANEDLLTDFNNGLEAFPAASERLAVLVGDNPEQSIRAERLRSLLSERIQIAEERIRIARTGRMEEARSITLGSGKIVMDQARATLAELISSEQQILSERTNTWNRVQTTGVSLALLAGALAIAGLIYLFMTMVRVNRGLGREIQARIAAEGERRKANQLYEAVFENAGDHLFLIGVESDGGFILLDGNRVFAEEAGQPIDALRGKSIYTLRTGPLGTELAAYYSEVLAKGKPVQARTEGVVNGKAKVWESVLVPVANEQDRIDRIVGVSRDITERERDEARRISAQKMEAVGHLTGGVAHDFNNLLQVVRGNLELLEPLIKDRDLAITRLRNAMIGADRAASLTRQLLAFARRQPLEPKVVNLGRLVNEMGDMLARTLGEGVAVETVVAGGLWNTLADPAQVESAILNLSINARDAMENAGRLTLELTNAVIDEAYAERDGVDATPGQYVMLAVSDTGKGMSPELLERVFEPFFTTKTQDKGTGLGLSMVYGFVKQSQGHIQIYSEEGEGTTVKIYLPRSHKSERIEVAVAKPRYEGENEVILVVEDEELVRNAAVGMLRDMGYTCLHATDGSQAIEMLQKGAKVDLLFTDVIMPGPVKVRDLAARAQEMIPGLPVLYTSGYTQNAIVHHGRLDEGVELLSKPYQRDVLAKRVRQMLDRTRPVVLVVEDEALVRMAAVDMITDLGFQVLEAYDATEALALLESQPRVDILFTDVGLPGMRGPELAEKARARSPNIRVIFASGYGEGGQGAPIGSDLLTKPYNQDDLAAHLKAVAALA